MSTPYKTITFFPISGFHLRGQNAEKIYSAFMRIAGEECNGRQITAFEKVVMEALEKRGWDKKGDI